MSIQAVSWALEQIAPMAPKFILVCLANYADENGECWPSIKTMARNAGCGERSVYRYLDELIELGLIEKEERTGKNGGRAASRYKLVTKTPSAKLADTPLCQSDQPPIWHTPSANVGIPPLPLVAEHIDEPSLEPSITSSSSLEREETSKNPSRVDWQARLAEAHRIAEGAVAVGGGGTIHPAAFRRLCEPVKGEPCDWDLDVIPAIASKAASMRAKGEKIQNWEWTMEGALRNRDRRLVGLPAPEAQPVRMVSQSNRESDAERIARIAAQNGWEAVA